jgi:hypothetical protein
VTPEAYAWLAVLTLIVLLIATISRRSRGPRSGPGPGAAGAVYELLSEDKRKAIEIIAEEKAEARDGETADDPPSPRLRRG